MTYAELLQTKEWYIKRGEIILRDNHTCQKCKYVDLMGNAQEKLDKEGLTQSQIDDITSEIIGLIFAQNELEKRHLEVHHSYYINNNKPWEYPNESLIALCNICHQDFHDKNLVPVYTNIEMSNQHSVIFCDKCNGSGYIPEYSHVQNGICFKCMGNRFYVI